MIPVAPPRFDRLLPPLRELPFNHLFALAVLEHKVDGRAWVDASENPAIFYVAHPYGMSLLYGTPRRDALPALRRHLLGSEAGGRDEWLQVGHAEWDVVLKELLGDALASCPTEPGGPLVQRFSRLNFNFDPCRYAQLRAAMPARDGISVQPATEAVFDRFGDSVAPRRFWRNWQQFAAAGGGYCTVQNGVPTALAFTSFVTDRQLEIGVETNPAWRGRGHAFHACAAMIDHCLRIAKEPVWSCRGENTGSVQLARKLGFTPTLELPYFRLPRSAAA